MRKAAAVVLACLLVPFSFGQNPDTSCSQVNKNAIEDIYMRSAVDSNFFQSLDDGNMRRLTVTLKFCKLDIIKTLQTGQPAKPDQIMALLKYDDLSEKVLAETMRRSCSASISSRDSQQPSSTNAGSTLRIVNDHIVKVNDGDCIGCLYAVKGSIYNPNNDGVKNVVINYYLYKKYMGEGAPTANPITGNSVPKMWKTNGGAVTATIQYLPSKQTVDFLATGKNAPVMTPESGLAPDPLSAEINADWDR